MKRFRRILFIIITTISLLLAALFIALWVRGYRKQPWRSIDAVLYERHTENGLRHKGKSVFELFGFVSERGRIYVTYRGSQDNLNDWLFNGVLPLKQTRFKFGHDFNNIGADYYSPHWIGPIFKITVTKQLDFVTEKVPDLAWSYQWWDYDEFYAYGTPTWIPVILFSILPFLAFTGIFKKRQRLADGLCIHCGSDLRATPDRCPECGRVPTARAKEMVNEI